VHGGVAAGGQRVELGELGGGRGEADVESFDFAGPALLAGFGDAGGEVVADLGDAVPLGGIGPVHGASQAALTEMILLDSRGTALG
jgi:hypothetical protein